MYTLANQGQDELSGANPNHAMVLGSWNNIVRLWAPTITRMYDHADHTYYIIFKYNTQILNIPLFIVFWLFDNKKKLILTNL